MVLVQASGANALTVATNYTFDAGSLGMVVLSSETSGGSIIINANRTVTITSSPYIGFFAPQITFNNNSRITASGSNQYVEVGSGGTAGYLNIAGGILNIADGVTLTSTGGIALPIAEVSLGNGSVLHSDVTTGTAIGNPAGLQAFTIRGANGGTGTISTGGGSINLWSYGTLTFDKTSGSTTLNFSGGTLNAWSNNGVTTIKSGVSVNSTNDINFNVQTGTVEANGQLNTTSSGSISLTALTGTLSIGSNAIFYAEEGNIIIHNIDTAGGTINISSGADIHAYTLSNPALGNVTLVIGSQAPNQVTGTPPANVTVNEVAGGQVFFGTNGITTSGPNNTLNALARNITFDSGSAPAKCPIHRPYDQQYVHW